MSKLLKIIITVIVLLTAFPVQAGAQDYDLYTVQPGDTLWKISVRYKVGLSEIINANRNIENPDLIYPGQRVKVPAIDETKQIEREVIRLTNIKRQNHGLPKLKADWEVSRVARHKSRDMRNNGYFSHTSPNYGSPFEMLRDYNVNFRAAAENIAAGQQTASQVVEGWMDSPGHRKNILNESYTHIGVGYAEGGSHSVYWTQMFISK
ncbi:SafA/ExsA family spore coat assembly protein [Alteribacillus bidgolensis]|uniref:Spore coat assembly protein SafA/uncharacterized protein, YkwD family n=1 Tax=Alteribacillus bidgolensis TaxID=930129 RepID=A0A1G8FNR3_9BACI|nr:SafA/ExsA family spore coat assembly protein [Alteribacillus bidgolensis]SDH83798.1 spore coat assembly protein SafA/uncharacterized protein, YkwD family [Alteribacillus bidgolensis]